MDRCAVDRTAGPPRHPGRASSGFRARDVPQPL